MHERHVVYRIEEDKKWCLGCQEEGQVLIGNQLTNGKLNYNPALLEKELALELQRQRLLNASLEAHSDMLINAGAALGETYETSLKKTEALEKIIQEQKAIIENLRGRLHS